MIGRSWRGVALVGGVAFVLAGCPKKDAGPSDAAVEAGPVATVAPEAAAPPPAASTASTPAHIDCAKTLVQVGNYCVHPCTDDSSCPGNSHCTATGKVEDGTNNNKYIHFCLTPQLIDAGVPVVPPTVVDAGAVAVVDAGPVTPTTKVIRIAHAADGGACQAGYKLAGQFCRLACATNADCGGTSGCKVFSTAGGAMLCADPL